MLDDVRNYYGNIPTSADLGRPMRAAQVAMPAICDPESAGTGSRQRYYGGCGFGRARAARRPARA